MLPKGSVCLPVYIKVQSGINRSCSKESKCLCLGSGPNGSKTWLPIGF